MSPDSTRYGQETFEGVLYWPLRLTGVSYYLCYDVFGDSYDGSNDWPLLYCITDPVALCGTFPGPGDFDN